MTKPSILNEKSLLECSAISECPTVVCMSLTIQTWARFALFTIFSSTEFLKFSLFIVIDFNHCSMFYFNQFFSVLYFKIGSIQWWTRKRKQNKNAEIQLETEKQLEFFFCVRIFSTDKQNKTENRNRFCSLLRKWWL